MPFVSNSGDDFEVSVTPVDTSGSSTGNIDWRDRGDSSNGAQALVQLGEDLGKNNSGIIRVTLSSLPAGSYNAVSFHMDPGFDQSDFIQVLVSTDGGATFANTGVSGDGSLGIAVNSLSTSNIMATQAEFSFEANGTDDVVIVFDGSAGNNAGGGADSETPLSGLRVDRFPPGVTIDPALVSVSENGTVASYDIHLDSLPSGPVEITATADGETEVSLDGVSFASAVTFNLTDLSAQSVMVRALDDTDVEGAHSGTISHAVTNSADSLNYPTTFSISPLTVSIGDNDVPGIDVFPTTLSVTEGSSTDTVSVSLFTVPSGPVELTVAANDAQTELSLDGVTFANSVSFSRVDTSVQAIIVRAVDDADDEGAHTSSVSTTVTATADPTNYPTSMSGPLANVNVFDNDAALYALIDIGPNNQRVEPLAVDFSTEDNGTNGQNGFDSFTALDGDAFTVRVNNVDQSGANVGGIDWRDRGNGSTDPLVRLGEDFVKNNGGIVRVTLGSIPAGTYLVTSYHADVDFTQSGTIEVWKDENGSGTFVDTGAVGNSNIAFGGAGDLTTQEVIDSSAQFVVTADGTNDIRLVFDGRPHSDNETPLNGLQLLKLFPPDILPDSSSVTAAEGDIATMSGTISDRDSGDSIASFTADVGNLVDNMDGTWDLSL